MNTTSQLIKDIVRLTPEIEMFLQQIKELKEGQLDSGEVLNTFDGLFMRLKPVGEATDNYMKTYYHG